MSGIVPRLLQAMAERVVVADGAMGTMLQASGASGDDFLGQVRVLRKCIGALVFYPLTWLAIAALVATRAGLIAALLTLIVLPLLSYVALRVFELLDDIIGRVRATMRRDVGARQRALRADIITIADEMAAPAIATAPSL